MKYIHESLVRFLKESDKEGVPEVLPNPDLKAIAMESDARNSIKARLPFAGTLRKYDADNTSS